MPSATILLLLVTLSLAGSSHASTCQWTEWLNDGSTPSHHRGWSYEGTLTYRANGKIPDGMEAVDIRVVTATDKEMPAEDTGYVHNFLYYNTRYGFGCRDTSGTDRGCPDYKAKFCLAECVWQEDWHNTDDPATGTGDWESASMIDDNDGCPDGQSVKGVQGRKAGDTSRYGNINVYDWALSGAVCVYQPSQNADYGCVCVNYLAPGGQCQDYEIRVCCG